MISIIIINKNDAGIENTLEHLFKIPKPEKTEIIVVDASEGKLDYIRKKFPKVRWFNFKNKTNKKITIPEQRNYGIKKAKGEIIVFIDANCIPDKNWLNEITKPILKEKEFYVTGVVKSKNANKIYDITWEKIKNIRYRNEAGSANTAFKKEIISKVGYFDETFDYGSDVEFSWRVIDAGYKIRYIPKAVISHGWGTFKQQIKRAYFYGIARARLYKKYTNRIKNLFGYDFQILAYPLFILFLPLALFWPYYLLLIVIPLLKNIKNSPIKTFFINIITGIGVLVGVVFK